jgi:hypothetical protein
MVGELALVSSEINIGVVFETIRRQGGNLAARLT